METRKTHSMLKQCNELLGITISAPEKQEILESILVVCYTSMKFQLRHQALCREQNGTEECSECYRSKGIVYLPQDIRWDRLKKANADALPALLQKVLMAAMDCMPVLQRTCNQTQGLCKVGGEPSKRILLLFDEVLFSRQATLPVDFAAIYEILISQSSPQKAKGALSLYMPRQQTELLINLLQPVGGRILDPCCGSAGLLSKVADYMSAHQLEFQLYGQEADAVSWRMAAMMFYFKGTPIELGEHPTNALMTVPNFGKQMDYVIGNPPFNKVDWHMTGEDTTAVHRWKYGVPPPRGGDFAWLQQMLYCLDKKHGRLCTILSLSSLTSSNHAESAIRQRIVKDGILEAIVLLPAGMFYGTKVSVCMWLLNMAPNEASRGKILLLDASTLGVASGRWVQLSEQGHQQILQVYRAYQLGEQIAQMGFCATITVEQVLAQDGMLDPKRYVTYEARALLSMDELICEETRLQEELYFLLKQNKEISSQIYNRR